MLLLVTRYLQSTDLAKSFVFPPLLLVWCMDVPNRVVNKNLAQLDKDVFNKNF